MNNNDTFAVATRCTICQRHTPFMLFWSDWGWRCQDHYPKVEEIGTMSSYNPDDFPNESAFARFAESQLQDVLQLLRRKGDHYADSGRDEHAWANYAEMAAMMHRSTPEAILHACMKHIWVIVRWSQGNSRANDISERIRDVIVYLLLLLFYWSWEQRIQDRKNALDRAALAVDPDPGEE